MFQNIYIYILKIQHYFLNLQLYVSEGSLEVTLPTVWADGNAEVGRVREEKGRREKIREEKDSVYNICIYLYLYIFSLEHKMCKNSCIIYLTSFSI